MENTINVAKLDNETILKMIFPVVRRLLDEYKFLNISNEEFVSILKNEIKKSKKYYNGKISYEEYMIKQTKTVLDKRVRYLLNNKEKGVRKSTFTLINNYLDARYNEITDYETAFTCLNDLDNLFKRNEFSYDVDFLIKLLKLEKISKSVSLIVEKYTEEIDDNSNELIDKLINIYHEQDEELESTFDIDYSSLDKNEVDSIKLYLNEIGKIKLLTSEEEKEFWKKINNGSISAKKEFCERNLRLVVNIAKKYLHLGLPFEDLIQEGSIGLMNAIDKFDPSLGFKFSTYAYFHIKESITKAISYAGRNIKISKKKIQDLRNLYKITNYLEEKLGRTPTMEEISIEMNESVEKIRELLLLKNDTASTNELVGPEKDTELENFISDDYNLEEDVEIKELPIKIQELFNNCSLTPKEKTAISYRFGFVDGDPHELERIGKKMNCTRENARKIVNSALDKIKSSKYIKSFLVYMDSPTSAIENLQKYREEKEEKSITRKVFLARQKERYKTPDIHYKNEIKEASEEIPVITDNNESSQKEDVINPHEVNMPNLNVFNLYDGMSLQETMVISLLLGTLNGTKYKFEEIANLLKISEKECIEISKNALLKYKDNLENSLNTFEGNKLSLK